MAEKCPICFNDIGTFTDDPMKSPNHFKVDLRGFVIQRSRHITEIQNRINFYETQFGVSPATTWTPTTEGEYPYRGQHINEIRIAIEGILTKLGVSLQDFLSADENGVPTGSPSDWLDGSRLPQDTIVRAMHVEEIRRKIEGGTEYSTIFSCSGDYRDETLQGLGVVSPKTQNPFFNKFIRTECLLSYEGSTGPGSMYYRYLNNVYDFLIYQLGTLHLFNCMPTTFYYIPTYSYNATKNIDKKNWEGFIKHIVDPPPNYVDPSLYPVKFDPPLPLNYETDSIYDSGIMSLAIDDSDVDNYYMYTIEFFYERAGFIGKTAYDFNTVNCFYDAIPNYIAKYMYPKSRNIGISNGEPGQSFDASEQGIKIPILNSSEKIYVGSREWTRVDNFDESVFSSLHYVIENETGVVTFGNGIQGKIPESGSTITIFMTLFGGGIWEYVEIVVSRDVTKFYYGIQAKNGKIWYMQKYNPYEIVDTTPVCTQTYLTPTDHSESYSHGFLEWEVYQSNFRYIYGNTCEITGGTTVTPNPVWSGYLDGTITLDTRYVTPYFFSDNPLDFDFIWQDNTSYFPPTLEAELYSERGLKVTNFSGGEYIWAIYEGIEYGDAVYTDPPGIWEFVTNPSSSITIYMSPTSALNWTSFFDNMGDIDSVPLADPSWVYFSSGSNFGYTKEEGDIFKKLEWLYEYSYGQYVIYYESVAGVTERLSESIPLIVTEGHRIDETFPLLYGGESVVDDFYFDTMSVVLYD